MEIDFDKGLFDIFIKHGYTIFIGTIEYSNLVKGFDCLFINTIDDKISIGMSAGLKASGKNSVVFLNDINNVSKKIEIDFCAAHNISLVYITNSIDHKVNYFKYIEINKIKAINRYLKNTISNKNSLVVCG